MNFSNYEPTLPYPNRRNFEKVNAFKGTTCLGSWHSVDFKKQKCGDLATFKAAFPGAVFKTETDYAGYDQALIEFNQAAEASANKFKADLIAEFGIADHPNANKIIDYAWELGEDFKEIAKHCKRIVELIK